jgi:hypothetical protein
MIRNATTYLGLTHSSNAKDLSSFQNSHSNFEFVAGSATLVASSGQSGPRPRAGLLDPALRAASEGSSGT